jgi:hypothetical protein
MIDECRLTSEYERAKYKRQNGNGKYRIKNDEHRVLNANRGDEGRARLSGCRTPISERQNCHPELVSGSP